MNGPDPISNLPGARIDEKRLRLMLNGIEELERFLEDLLTQGLASLEESEGSFMLEQVAANMVNAKMGASDGSCVNCNRCAIADACPSDAFVRVPADDPYPFARLRGEA